MNSYETMNIKYTDSDNFSMLYSPICLIFYNNYTSFVEHQKLSVHQRRHVFKNRRCNFPHCSGRVGLPDGLVNGRPDGLVNGLPEGLVNGLPDGLVNGLPDGLVNGLDGRPLGLGRQKGGGRRPLLRQKCVQIIQRIFFLQSPSAFSWHFLPFKRQSLYTRG